MNKIKALFKLMFTNPKAVPIRIIENIKKLFLFFHTTILNYRNNHFEIKKGYKYRLKPSYFEDELPDGFICQPELYSLAYFLGKKTAAENIIDIGCGRATKLARFYPEFNITGIDFGKNIDYCRQNYNFGQWIEHDIEKNKSLNLETSSMKNSIIICADIIEHLINPNSLLALLKSLLKDATLAIISTPERDLERGSDSYGPPENLCHVREWNLKEFERYLEEQGFNIIYAGLTLSNNQSEDRNTILAVLNNFHKPVDLNIDDNLIPNIESKSISFSTMD